MADTKISALTAVSSLAGTEEFPVVQTATTKKATIDQIFARANLYVDAANTLHMRNGATSQDLYVYRSYTDASNYSRLRLGYNSSLTGFFVASQAGGSGTATDLYLNCPTGKAIYAYVGVSYILKFDSTGLAFPNPNTNDIGAGGATPRTIYAGTSFRGPAGSASAVAYGAGAANIGMYQGSFSGVALAGGGVYVGQFVGGSGLFLASDVSLAWHSGSDGTSGSVRLKRDADNVLALRDGTGNVSQTLRIYASQTNISTDYERLAITPSAITIETAGTGTDDIDLSLVPAGTGVVKFGSHTTIASETITGYITVKDSGGTSRKLAVVS